MGRAAAEVAVQRGAEVRGLWRRVLRYTKKARAHPRYVRLRVRDAPGLTRRGVEQMPKAQQDYYYSYARQNFINFADEEDPERVNFLIERGQEHISFIIKKYDLDMTSGGAHFDKQ